MVFQKPPQGILMDRKNPHRPKTVGISEFTGAGTDESAQGINR